jgi:hypothetical protein
VPAGAGAPSGIVAVYVPSSGEPARETLAELDADADELGAAAEADALGAATEAAGLAACALGAVTDAEGAPVWAHAAVIDALTINRDAVRPTFMFASSYGSFL